MVPVLPECSEGLYRFMLHKGYPDGIALVVAREMNTEYTANRMTAYLSHYGVLPMETLADELLAIKSERDAIVRRKEKEYYQHGINLWLNSPERGQE